MVEAVQKTLILLLLIGLGLALRSKIKNKTEINGIKEIILSIALPSTVFIALMGIKISASLLIYPVLVLAFNFFIYLTAPYCLPIFGIEKDTFGWAYAHNVVAFTRTWAFEFSVYQ